MIAVIATFVIGIVVGVAGAYQFQIIRIDAQTSPTPRGRGPHDPSAKLGRDNTKPTPCAQPGTRDVPRPASGAMIALLRLAWILSLAGAVPAGATASLTCEADDRNLSFNLLGNIGSGDGGAIQLIGGEIKLKSVRGKFDARQFKVAPEHMSGQWSFGKELRIGISLGIVEEVSVFLAIIAVRAKNSDSDLDRYRGEYVLKVQGPKGESVLRGRLKDCSSG